MAADSDRDRSRFVEPLPARPNLEMQQKRAKDLLRAAWDHDPSALERLHALHPKPPAVDALSLADAQLIVARGYGFENWAGMKRKIESLTHTPVERFTAALHRQDIDEVRHLLDTSAEVRAAINSPLSHFGGRPVIPAKKNLPLLDLLLEYGADINLKSDWWAGGFGILEYDCTPEEAAPLVERGATIDVFAASHLGMFDRLRELIDRDPSLVHGRGGDGKTPLHNSKTVEIATCLVEHGAVLDARCVDHESTPAQYLVRDAPLAVRYLLDRGAWFEIFMAIALDDAGLVERCLREDPGALDHRIGEGLYAVAHNGKRAATRDEIGDRRGDIYRWVLDAQFNAFDVAARFGSAAMLERLLARASLAQRFLAACRRGDRVTTERLAAEHPGIVSTLTPGDQRLLVQSVQRDDLAAVTLMLDLGFDPHVTGQDTGDAWHWASFLGNRQMLELLLTANPAINSRDATHGGTALGWCIVGSLHGWRVKTGDFAGVAELLIKAGERVEPDMLPTGRDDVDRILRAHLGRSPDR